MNKRGQIYILVALVLAVVIFSMSQIVNKTYQESMESRFESLSENYAVESSKLINILSADMDMDSETKINNFISFTKDFTSYAKTVNPDFQIIYVFKLDDEIYIGNFLALNILVEIGNQIKPLEGCLSKLEGNIDFGGFGTNIDVDNTEFAECTETFKTKENKVKIIIENVLYQFQVYENRPEIVIVGWNKR